jgi:folate-binding protein YgfZ
MIHQTWQSFLQRTAAHEPAAPTAPVTGITYLPALTGVAFDGTDVRRFLQGYLTCDTQQLTADQAQPAAFCNLKGRVIANGWCLAPGPDRVLMIMDRSLFEPLNQLLQVYLRFSRTGIADLHDTHLIFGAVGLAPLPGSIRLDSTRQLCVYDSVEAARALWLAHPRLPASAWMALLISDGIPLLCAATSNAFLPQMLDLPALGAIDFNKGCYLGQEVVARAQHRGEVKRHLLKLQWQGDTPPAAGTSLEDAGGRARGMVIQTTGATGKGLALAVVQDATDMPLRGGAATFTPLILQTDQSAAFNSG